jgi:hypothetical protein
MSFTVENAQVKRQHDKNEGIKEYPKYHWRLHMSDFKLTTIITRNLLSDLTR